MGSALAAAICVSSMAVLGLACSVDLTKLRTPLAAALDGGSDIRQAGFVADAVPEDIPSAPSDLPGNVERAVPDLGNDSLPQVGPDGRDDLPKVEQDVGANDTQAATRDVPLAEEANSDSVSADDARETGRDVGIGKDVRTEDMDVSEGTGGAAGDPDLVLWYRFDESSGTVATDSSATGLDGKLAVNGAGGSATFSTDCQVGTHALRLTPASSGSSQAGGYVTTPAPTSLAPNAITIALWVKLTSSASDQSWARLFDFGTGTGANDPYLYITSRTSDTSNPRFGITNIGRGVGGVQRIDSPSPLSANVWHHIAIVLPAGTTYTGSLYVDGVVVATNSAMTVHPADVGVTTDNWLGRSPSSVDPYLNGWLDDFRIYKRALSAAEITALMALR